MSVAESVPRRTNRPGVSAVGLRGGGGDVEHDLGGVYAIRIVVDVLADDSRGKAAVGITESRVRIIGAHPQRRGADGHVGYARPGQHGCHVQSAGSDGTGRSVILEKEIAGRQAAGRVVGACGIKKPADGPVVTRANARPCAGLRCNIFDRASRVSQPDFWFVWTFHCAKGRADAGGALGFGVGRTYHATNFVRRLRVVGNLQFRRITAGEPEIIISSRGNRDVAADALTIIIPVIGDALKRA